MALLDNIPGWKVFSTGIGIGALLLVGYFVWAWFLRAPQDLKDLEREALEHVLEQLAEHYEGQVRERGQQRLVVMPVQGDTSNGEIRARLFDRLEDVEGVTPIPPPDPDIEERATSLFKSVVGGEEPEVDPEQVFEKAAEADEVLSLRVAKLWAGADSGLCELDVYRIVRGAGQERQAEIAEPLHLRGVSGTAAVEEEPVDDGPGFWASVWGVLWRFLAVAAAVLVLPFLSWPVAGRVFRADSNLANGLLLAVLTGADIAVLLATVSFELSTTVVVVACLLLPVGGLVNLRVLNWIEER